MILDVMKQFANKRIMVLGAGLTGMSCVRFLHQYQLSCVLNDSRDNAVDLEEFISAFPENNVVLGYWDKEEISQADVLFVSPGVDLVAQGLVQHIPDTCNVLGDVELFCQLNDKPIVAVTGSNGKSTVVSLLAEVAESLGKKAALAGNIGTPVLEQLDADVELFILELSSFQLETLRSLKAKVATVLNVSDDHLDRHHTLERYGKIKQKIYQQCQFAVINKDDELTHVPVEFLPESITSFGLNSPTKNQFGLTRHNNRNFLARGEVLIKDVAQLPLAGFHNALNYLAVLAITNKLEWNEEQVVNAFMKFDGLAHRCTVIKSLDDILWIDDSKATNVGATVAAVNGLTPQLNGGKLILILGGDGKGADFSPLESVLSTNVGTLITLGKDGPALAKMKPGARQVNSMVEAVDLANSIASAGDIVLLSPACASIDMFKNFIERGEKFAHAVHDLQEAC